LHKPTWKKVKPKNVKLKEGAWIIQNTVSRKICFGKRTKKIQLFPDVWGKT